MCGVSPIFVYTMSQVWIYVCVYDGRVKDLGKEVDYGSFFRGDDAA